MEKVLEFPENTEFLDRLTNSQLFKDDDPAADG
jgi:hypothetical protein